MFGAYITNAAILGSFAKFNASEQPVDVPIKIIFLPKILPTAIASLALSRDFSPV